MQQEQTQAAGPKPGNGAAKSAAAAQAQKSGDVRHVSGPTGRFMKGLLACERERDCDAVASTFADDAEVASVGHREIYEGKDGARRFWHAYVSQFQQVETRFTNVTEAGNHAILEWTSHATLKNGRPFTYDGVSIIETKDGLVERFRTYYDTAAFLMPHATGGLPS